MARMTFKAGDEYSLKLSKLAANGLQDEIAKKAIYAAAGIVTDRIRAELNWTIGGNENSKSTGDLEDSLGIAKIDLDKTGNWNTKIGFDGYDRKGVPNQLKARVLESGTSTIKKRPFVRRAVNATKDNAQNEMAKVIDKEIAKIMK